MSRTTMHLREALREAGRGLSKSTDGRPLDKVIEDAQNKLKGEGMPKDTTQGSRPGFLFGLIMDVIRDVRWVLTGRWTQWEATDKAKQSDHYGQRSPPPSPSEVPRGVTGARTKDDSGEYVPRTTPLHPKDMPPRGTPPSGGSSAMPSPDDKLKQAKTDAYYEMKNKLADAWRGDIKRLDRRPVTCRFRLKDEGRSYPRSACFACKRDISSLGPQCHLGPSIKYGVDMAEEAKPHAAERNELGLVFSSVIPGKKALRFLYWNVGRGQGEERTVIPLAVIHDEPRYHPGKLCLVAHCVDRNALRTFPFDQMTHIREIPL